MNGLTIKNTNDKLIMSIDKESFSEAVLLKILKVAHTEYLIKKASFKENILEVEEEIKSNWWQQNRQDILSKLEG